jgi:hypothetical protein
MAQEIVFIGYASQPPGTGETIEDAVKTLATYAGGKVFETWRQLDIAGKFIIDGILAKIEAAAFVVMDITRMNFNVNFEVGYALGRGKRVVLTVNSALNPPLKEYARLGIFDTLGYQTYANSQQLSAFLNKIASYEPPRFSKVEVDRTSPVYLIDTHYKTNPTTHTKSRLARAKINVRVFDPIETPRLSALEAYRGVASSVGVVVQLLSSQATDYEFNNLRASFVAGLALGMDRHLLMLQEGDDPVPLDYRDLVSPYKSLRDIDRHINSFAPKIMEGVQKLRSSTQAPPKDLLETLKLGESSAENEETELENYYLPTDGSARTLQGSARLIVGRKGSGKTALFIRVRDVKKQLGRKTVVLDLKPEGYQLKQFKEQVLHTVSEGTSEHLAVAFWEAVLLLEVVHKLLEMDQRWHLRDHHLFEPYKTLLAYYPGERAVGEGEFSERLSKIVNRAVKAAEISPVDSISSSGISNSMYTQELPKLREALIAYLKNKDALWILFDNIDKGWPTHGADATDILLVRCLLEAARKIENNLRKEDIEAHLVVFLRNDVYELLVEQTPDRGKDTRVSLDWTDAEQLKELLRLRFVYSGIQNNTSFRDAWVQICTPHIDGEPTEDYLLERSLMRPRNFINLVSYCCSYAINMGHDRITVDDIRKAEKQYSVDVSNEIGLEIRDVFREAQDILYEFIYTGPRIKLADVYAIFDKVSIPTDRTKALLDTLLWFGFLGAVVGSNVYYAYTVHYDMKKLRKLASDFQDVNIEIEINRAFWPFLEIAPS